MYGQPTFDGSTNINPYTSSSDRNAHNTQHPEDGNTLTESQLEDSDAFKVTDESKPETTKVKSENGVLIERYNQEKGVTEEKMVLPVIDLREYVDNEGIRQGLNHPAVLVDLNAVYLARLNEAVKTTLTPTGFVEATATMVLLRDNPDWVFEKAFTDLMLSWKKKAADIPADKPEIKTRAENIYKWNEAVATKIAQKPNAFLYNEHNVTENTYHSEAVAFVRPADNDTSLFAFTRCGLVELSAPGLLGEDLVDLSRIFDPQSIVYHSEKVQNEPNSPYNSEFKLEDIKATIYPDDPEYESKMAIFNRLAPKFQEAQLDFKMGYNSTKNHINPAELEILKERLEAASTKPWPQIERKTKQLKEQSSKQPSGTDLLGSF